MDWNIPAVRQQSHQATVLLIFTKLMVNRKNVYQEKEQHTNKNKKTKKTNLQFKIILQTMKTIQFPILLIPVELEILANTSTAGLDANHQ